MARDRLKVVIVGAGIGGLAAHLACARAGFDKVHDRLKYVFAASFHTAFW